MPEQLVFELPHRAAMGLEDFLVSDSNAAAVALIDRWPDWPVGAAVLVTLPQALTVFQEYENLMLGLVIILAMIFMRDGIVPTVSRLVTRARA